MYYALAGNATLQLNSTRALITMATSESEVKRIISAGAVPCLVANLTSKVYYLDPLLSLAPPHLPFLLLFSAAAIVHAMGRIRTRFRLMVELP